MYYVQCFFFQIQASRKAEVDSARAAQQPKSRWEKIWQFTSFLFVPVIYTGHTYTTAGGMIVILCTVQFGIDS